MGGFPLVGLGCFDPYVRTETVGELALTRTAEQNQHLEKGQRVCLSMSA